MTKTEEIIEYLCAKKAAESNTIDLNAYAIGVNETLEYLFPKRPPVLRPDWLSIDTEEKCLQRYKLNALEGVKMLMHYAEPYMEHRLRWSKDYLESLLNN